MEELKVGDVVKLKSGGYDMTVSYIEKDERSKLTKVFCKYFHGGDIKEAVFYAPMLEKLKD